MRFGYHTASFHHEGDASPWQATVAFARRVEDARLEWFSAIDHRWQLPCLGRRGAPFFGCTTTLPTIVQATDRVEPSVPQTAVIRETTEGAHEADLAPNRETEADALAGCDDCGPVGTLTEVVDAVGRSGDVGAGMASVRAEGNDPETVDNPVAEVVPAFA